MKTFIEKREELFKLYKKDFLDKSAGMLLINLLDKIEKQDEEFINSLKKIEYCVEVKNKKNEIYFATPFKEIDKLSGYEK